MTEDEIRDIARTAAREAVHELMISLGADVSNPAAKIEMQKDFQSLREWRQSMQAVRRHGLLTAAGVVVVGVLGVLYMNFTTRP